MLESDRKDGGNGGSGGSGGSDSAAKQQRDVGLGAVHRSIRLKALCNAGDLDQAASLFGRDPGLKTPSWAGPAAPRCPTPTPRRRRRDRGL